MIDHFPMNAHLTTKSLTKPITSKKWNNQLGFFLCSDSDFLKSHFLDRGSFHQSLECVFFSLYADDYIHERASGDRLRVVPMTWANFVCRNDKIDHS